MVAHDKGGVQFFDGPRRRESAFVSLSGAAAELRYRAGAVKTVEDIVTVELDTVAAALHGLAGA